MIHHITAFLKLEKKPKRGLLAIEWVVIIYTILTFLQIFFTYSKLVNPNAMISGRIQIMAMTAALWAAYRWFPCRFTLVARVIAQMSLLAWWYPDTYELNRVLPNLDHYFALCEQSLFGMQSAIAFFQAFPSPIISELMSMGYASFYPMIAFTVLYYMFCCSKQFHRCAFVIVASFFTYYIIYDLLPVVGPTFYFKAIGMEQALAGKFSALGDYFSYHRDCLPTPGYTNGFFYHLVEDAKAAGERPTAAFPSSHVGIATVCMLLFGHVRRWKILAFLSPLYFFLCMATVYIQAHYVIDAIAGLISGVLLYIVFISISRHFKETF